MLGHRHSPSGHHEGSGGGYVESTLGVAAGAAHIDGLYGYGHLDHLFPHSLGKSGNLGGCFPFGPQRYQKTGNLQVAEFP